MGVCEFLNEVSNEIENGGITAGNVADIAKTHGLSDPGLFISIPGFRNLYFLWDITEEAARAFINLLNERDDFTVVVSPLLSFICGGSIPTMPMAKRVYNYKKEHWLPVYFDKKRRDAV